MGHAVGINAVLSATSGRGGKSNTVRCERREGGEGERRMR